MAPCGLEGGAWREGRSGLWGRLLCLGWEWEVGWVSPRPPLIFTLPVRFLPSCPAHKGPGQQGREAEGEGDHLRLRGVRVRGAAPGSGIVLPRDPALVKQGSVTRPFPGSAWSSSPAGRPGLPLALSQACQCPGACTGATVPPPWWLGVAFIGLCLRGLPWAQWCCCQTFPLVKKILAPAPALLLLGKTRAPPLPLALPFPGCP